MTSKPLRAVIIEDAPSTLSLLEMALTLVGFTSSGHVTGPEGLEACLAEIPDLIVLDIALPGADGWHVLEQLRAAPATMSTPVLVVTAHGYEGMHDRATSRGADAFLTKPFDLRSLQATALALVGNSQVTTATGSRPTTPYPDGAV